MFIRWQRSRGGGWLYWVVSSERTPNGPRQTKLVSLRSKRSVRAAISEAERIIARLRRELDEAEARWDAEAERVQRAMGGSDYPRSLFRPARMPRGRLGQRFKVVHQILRIRVHRLTQRLDDEEERLKLLQTLPPLAYRRARAGRA